MVQNVQKCFFPEKNLFNSSETLVLLHSFQVMRLRFFNEIRITAMEDLGNTNSTSSSMHALL